MQKVISFRVDQSTYNEIKKMIIGKNLSFRAIFEPYAIQICENSNIETKYTGSIPTNCSDLYKDIQLVLKKYDKVFKKYLD